MSYSILTASHGDTVLTALRGGTRAAALGSHVLASWRRCVDEFGLDPAEGGDPEIVDRTELAERREHCCQLVGMAKSEMTNLYQQVAGSGYSILLSDGDGVVLNYVGDPLFTTAAANTGMQTGAVWTERAQGTNGIGCGSSVTTAHEPKSRSWPWLHPGVAQVPRRPLHAAAFVSSAIGGPG